MNWRFWKKKPCLMCSIYANRMRNIRNLLYELKRLTTGKSTLTDKDLMDVLSGLGYIHIEASRQEMKK